MAGCGEQKLSAEQEVTIARAHEAFAFVCVPGGQAAGTDPDQAATDLTELVRSDSDAKSEDGRTVRQVVVDEANDLDDCGDDGHRIAVDLRSVLDQL